MPRKALHGALVRAHMAQATPQTKAKGWAWAFWVWLVLMLTILVAFIIYEPVS